MTTKPHRSAHLLQGTSIAMVLAIVGLASAAFASSQGHPSEPSAASAAPSTAYVSELGPALSHPPARPAELPASGGGSWPATPQIAGLVLTLLGASLVFAGLRLHRWRPAEATS